MTIFVKNKESEIETTVESFSEEFSNFIKTKSKIVKTSGKRTFMTLPYIFEQIDDSNTYIIRRLTTDYIKPEHYNEVVSDLQCELKIKEE